MGTWKLWTGAVIPEGKAPSATITLALAFTSDAWTVTEKLLFGKTVTGDGLMHSASNAGFVAEYGKGAEVATKGPGFDTVKERAPDWLTKLDGKKAEIVEGYST
jgi:hypothetical protein